MKANTSWCKEMSIGQKFIQVLILFDFVKVAREKCPQGYEESNYQCFYHKEWNAWCEVYLSDPIPYVWIVGKEIKSSAYLGGKFFEDPKELKKLLTKIDSI